MVKLNEGENMKTKQITKLFQYGERLKSIANSNKHNLYRRNNAQIELVRNMGDQIDSRFDIVEKDGKIECFYSFQIDCDTKNSETIYDDVEDYNFFEEIEKVMKKSNKEFNKALIDKDENINDW